MQLKRLKRFATQALLPHLVLPADAIVAALGSEQIDHPARRLSDPGPDQSGVTAGVRT